VSVALLFDRVSSRASLKHNSAAGNGREAEAVSGRLTMRSLCAQLSVAPAPDVRSVPPESLRARLVAALPPPLPAHASGTWLSDAEGSGRDLLLAHADADALSGPLLTELLHGLGCAVEPSVLRETSLAELYAIADSDDACASWARQHGFVGDANVLMGAVRRHRLQPQQLQLSQLQPPPPRLPQPPPPQSPQLKRGRTRRQTDSAADADADADAQGRAAAGRRTSVGAAPTQSALRATDALQLARTVAAEIAPARLPAAAPRSFGAGATLADNWPPSSDGKAGWDLSKLRAIGDSALERRKLSSADLSTASTPLVTPLRVRSLCFA
jgi:hypothetical protein